VQPQLAESLNRRRHWLRELQRRRQQFSNVVASPGRWLDFTCFQPPLDVVDYWPAVRQRARTARPGDFAQLPL
jgi:hypothetical protein